MLFPVNGPQPCVTLIVKLAVIGNYRNCSSINYVRIVGIKGGKKYHKICLYLLKSVLETSLETYRFYS